MKQTKQDREFARKFANALLPHVTARRDKGVSLTEIAEELGVTAAGLQKQFAGGTPSIRTVALAYAIYGVSVPYGDVAITKAISRKGKKKRPDAPDQQLLLPLDITVPPTSRRVELKPVPKTLRQYRLQITIGVAG